MVFTVLRFELAYWFRRPLALLFFVALFLMAFFSTASDAFLNVGGTGQIHRNAPFVLATAVAVLTAFGQVMTTAIAGTAVLRDAQLGTQELLYTTRMSTLDYLVGRFAGATIVMLAIYVALPIGLLVGTMMPWIAPDKLGPITLWGAFQPFLTIAVPNVLFVSALLFAVGALTRKLFAVYITGILLVSAWQITQQIVTDLDTLRLASAIDPFAYTSIAVITRYWSLAERNRLLVPLSGSLLVNRVLWIAIALALFGLVAAVFRMRLGGGRRVRRKPSDTAARAPQHVLSVPLVALRHDWWQWCRAALGQSAFHTRFIVKHAPFLAITAIAVANAMVSAWYTSHPGNAVTWPVTATLLPVLSDSTQLFVILIATLYAGELIWRERELRADQIVDTLPAPSWVGFVSKLGAVFLTECVLLLACAAGFVVIQLAEGYTRVEPLLYAETLAIGLLPGALGLVALSLGVHAIVNQKFFGHLLIIVYFVGNVVLSHLGLAYRLFQIGRPPDFTYSDMNRWGPYLPRVLVLNGYNIGCLFVLAAMGWLVLPRGTTSGWSARWRSARARWRGGGAWLTAACAGATTAFGGVFFHNATILNHYIGVHDAERARAAWERRYKPLATLPQPRIVGLSLRQDIYPSRRSAAWRGALRAVNRSSRSIDTLFVAFRPSSHVVDIESAASDADVHLDSLAFDRPATLIMDDTPKGVRLYRLTAPLRPGDSLTVRFVGRLEPHGFPNTAFNNDVVRNGTFISSGYLPSFGYDPDRELSDNDARARNALKPKPGMKSLDDPTIRENNYVTPNADWIAFDETACTTPDQIAIAPGYLEREWTANGRRCFHYVMDRPILEFTTTLSARLVADSALHDGVRVVVYHLPTHGFGVGSMMRAVNDGLDYYGAHFSPYQYRQFRIIEVPRYQKFVAESFPNTVPYLENGGFLYRSEKGDDQIDWPYFATAHELAHQWWAHQVVGAAGQGATMLSESLAEYSALTVMEHRYGPEAAQKFLHRELDNYLRGRGVERKKEVPLMYVEDQPYIHYRKGSLCLYALRDYIGESAMNEALHRFVTRWAFHGPPYPTSRDLLAEFDRVTPDSLKYVLRDLFEEMTFYDNKVDSATATRRADGRYVVHLVLASKKLKGDSLGNTREVPVADYIDVGIFGAHVAGQKLGARLLVRKIHITQPLTTLDFLVDAEPRAAGIDPYNILIDRTPEDNVTPVRRGADSHSDKE